jgi:hypothetical protein
MRLDRFEAAKILGVTFYQFAKLTSNPTFPKPISARGDRQWSADDIKSFARKLEACAARGWKVPEALFEWTFDTPPDWETRRLKLVRDREAARARRRN